MLVDIHCHLDHCKFDKDRDKVIERAKKVGITKIITNGTDHEKNLLALEYAKKYDIVEAALGIYPLDGIKMSDEDIEKELLFIKKNKNKIIAIGEVGIDLHYDKDPNNFEKQKNIFKKIIELGIKIKKPLIVHSRSAEEETIDILKNYNENKTILHCFGGNMSLVEKAEKLGYYFSIPTNIVYSKHFKKIVKKVSINKLLTETDSPYLSPIKGQRNEPSNVIYSIKKIAELKNMEQGEVINNIWMNYSALFQT